MTVNQRLNYLVNELTDSNSKEFARQIKVPYTTLRNYLSNVGLPNFDTINGISNQFPQVNLVWLIKGEGDPFNPEKKKGPVGGDGGLPKELSDELFMLRKEKAEFDAMKEQINLIIMMQSATGPEKARLQGRLKKCNDAPGKGRGFGVEQGKFLF